MARLYYGGHTYDVVTKGVNWHKAKSSAAAMGGHLVKIETAKENKAVFDFVTAESKTWSTHYLAFDGGAAEYVWIGASDAAREGDWRWTDGSTPKYFNWGYGREPDNYSNQDSAALALQAWPSPNGGLGNAGQWNDLSAWDSLYYVVEYNGKAGTAAADDLKGTSRADKLLGLAGNDILTGYGGTDTFVFNTKLNKTSNVDRITDYNVRYDTIQLENAIFKKLMAGKLSVEAFYIGAKAHDADDRIIYDKQKGALYYDPDGTGKAAQTLFATLGKGLKMTETDFFVI